MVTSPVSEPVLSASVSVSVPLSVVSVSDSSLFVSVPVLSS
ncbi:hypothetical protein [Ruoffia tabacinasalis]